MFQQELVTIRKYKTQIYFEDILQYYVIGIGMTSHYYFYKLLLHFLSKYLRILH